MKMGEEESFGSITRTRVGKTFLISALVRFIYAARFVLHTFFLIII